MSFNLSRRGFLMGVGAVALLPPSRLFAQTAPVGMTVAADGSLVFASNTAVRSAVLSELATGIARSAPTRGGAGGVSCCSCAVPGGHGGEDADRRCGPTCGRGYPPTIRTDTY